MRGDGNSPLAHPPGYKNPVYGPIDDSQFKKSFKPIGEIICVLDEFDHQQIFLITHYTLINFSIFCVEWRTS